MMTNRNKLIGGRIFYMSMNEMMIITETARLIKENDTEFKYRVPVDIIKAEGSLKEEIKKTIEKLSKRIVKVDSEDNQSISRYTIFSKIDYTDYSEYINVEFHPDLREYFLDLITWFKPFNFKTLMKIDSKYSYKMYDFLKKQKTFNKKIIDIELRELHSILKITDKNHKGWNNFSKLILKPAQKHLKLFSDISFKYESDNILRNQLINIRFQIEENKQ